MSHSYSGAPQHPIRSRPETLDMERLGKVGNFWGSQNNPLSSAQRLDPYDSYPQSDVAAFAAQTRLNPYVDLHASSLSQKLFKFLINITFSFSQIFIFHAFFLGSPSVQIPFPPAFAAGGCRANQAPSSKLTSRRSKSHLLPMSMMTIFLNV